MDNKKYAAEEIKLKVIKLLKHVDELEVTRSLLEKENTSLKNIIQSQKKNISGLEETNKMLKLADSLSNSKDNVRDIKLHITRYINEIDKCIKLLSDR